jgi:DNA-binding HxlR family transcriptional regulator
MCCEAEGYMSDQCDVKKAGEVEFRCYFQLAIMVIGGKWKPKVLFHLAQNDVVRFGALRRAVFGITEKMLIQSLKELEKDGLVNRKVYRQVPPKVEYSLTDLGKSFIPVLNAMFNWGKSYASYLVANQKKMGKYQAGNVFDNIDELVKSEGQESGLGSSPLNKRLPGHQ